MAQLMRGSLCAALALLLLTACSGEAKAPALPAAKQIALSFDDAPLGDGATLTGEMRTELLIEALEDAQTGPVVFFVTPHSFETRSRARIERYAAAGHLIANHSNTHPWAHKTDTPAYIADIDAAEAALDDIDKRRPWFRFPYLDEGRDPVKRDALRAALSERGLRNGYVTVDTYDWYMDGKWQSAVKAGGRANIEGLRDAYTEMIVTAAEHYDQMARRELEIAPPHMLLLHENDLAAHFIDDALAALRAKGWTIVSPDAVYADPFYARSPETLLSGRGLISALAVDGGMEPSETTHIGNEEARLDELLERRAAFVAAE